MISPAGFSTGIVNIWSWSACFGKKLSWIDLKSQKKHNNKQKQDFRETKFVNTVVLIYAWKDTTLNRVDGTTKCKTELICWKNWLVKKEIIQISG